jgi:transcriptional regulator with XRE-family HTH domain
VTVTYDVATSPTTDGGDLFRYVGTTSPTAAIGPRKFIACVLMASCAVTGTLTAVTPADAVALSTVVAQPSTLPAVSIQPTTAFDHAVVPVMLQRLRRVSGLSWGDIAGAVGVSRRTIHNWLGGAHVAGVHLARLLEVSRIVDLVSTGSVESTRTLLLQSGANGRSIIDDLALGARPARRSISTVSVGDLVTPVDETESARLQGPQRRASLRGGALPTRRLHGS